jgi:hypothetical protein
MDTDEFIADTMRRVASAAVPPAQETRPPVPTRRWHAPLAVAAAAVAVVLIVAAASMIGSHRSAGPSTTTQPPAGTCQIDYSRKPLPQWARAGFTPAGQPVAYALSDNGDMAAIVWATHHPLVAPPTPRHNNKILWVARVGAYEGPLRIRATLGSTGQTVTRTLTAAGPSTIDLPAAGCWSFDLRWGTHQDHLALGYASR